MRGRANFSILYMKLHVKDLLEYFDDSLITIFFTIVLSLYSVFKNYKTTVTQSVQKFQGLCRVQTNVYLLHFTQYHIHHIDQVPKPTLAKYISQRSCQVEP